MYPINCAHTTYLCFDNIHESRNLNLYIVKGVHFYAALMFTELCPFEYRQTEIDGCGVKGVYMTVKLKDLLYLPFVSFRNYEERELLRYSIITLLVGLTKIALCYGFSDSEVIQFSSMCFHRNDEIPKALAIG